MSNVANASINTLRKTSPDGLVQPDDILEIPLSDMQGLLNELLVTHNELTQIVQDAGILRGKELARLTEAHSRALKAERSPVTKLMLINAYIRQFLTNIRKALKTRPNESGTVINVCSKIMARAVQIVDYIRSKVADEPQRKEIALDSQQCRILFQGGGGEPVSRKETIRAMRRAEAMWPGLKCGHRPNDGRQTTRLTAKTDALTSPPIIGSRDTWQRSPQRIVLSL